MKNPAWASLKYMNPTKLLLGMDKMFDESGIKKYRNASDILLARPVRDIAEDRRCAIFCHGAGQVLGTQILFAPLESADYDYVGAYRRNGAVHTFPIQLKQLVPDRLNSSTSLQRRYPSSASTPTLKTWSLPFTSTAKSASGRKSWILPDSTSRRSGCMGNYRVALTPGCSSATSWQQS